MHEAESNPSRLVARAKEGEDTVVVRTGKRYVARRRNT